MATPPPAPADPNAQPAAGQAKATTPEPPPEKYTWTLPDGVTLDEGLMGKAEPVFRELGLNQRQAQRLVDLQVASQQAQEQAWQQQAKEWQDTVKADRELGGDKLEGSKRLVHSVVLKFGTQELVDTLEQTGMSNHPDLFRFLHKIGTAIGEDTLSGTVTSPGSAPSEEDRMRRMYPTMFKKE